MSEKPKKSKKQLQPEDTPTALAGKALTVGLATIGLGIASAIFVTLNINVQGYGPAEYVGPIGLVLLGSYFTFTGIRGKKEKSASSD